MVMYIYNANEPLMEPLKIRSEPEITWSYKDMFE